jgi:hypothetical protein
MEVFFNAVPHSSESPSAAAQIPKETEEVLRFNGSNLIFIAALKLKL